MELSCLYSAFSCQAQLQGWEGRQRGQNRCKILCTCGIVPGCVAGHRLGLVGSSRVGRRGVGALGPIVLRAMLVLRGVLGPYNS